MKFLEIPAKASNLRYFRLIAPTPFLVRNWGFVPVVLFFKSHQVLQDSLRPLYTFRYKAGTLYQIVKEQVNKTGLSPVFSGNLINQIKFQTFYDSDTLVL